MVRKKSDKKANKTYSDALALTFEDSIQPRSEKYLAKMADVLLDWAKLDDSYTMNQFTAKYQLPRKSFYRWVIGNERLGEAYDVAMGMLAARREVGALTRKLDAGIVATSMALYCPEWRTLREWMAKIKEEAAHSSSKIEIQLTTIPLTAEVTADIERKK